MRLFRRRNDDDAPGPVGPAFGAPAATTDDDVARQPQQPTGDWMTLPPLAPTFKAMPTTFRVQTLPEILTSHTDTRLSGSLGHAVSPDAPSGSVGGLASAHASAVPHSGDISRTAGMGELPLREPHHAPQDEPSIEVRRLPSPAPTSETAPLATPVMSTTTPVVSRLPEPAVSRSLLDTAPLAARPAAERPLPVARVVDTPSPASTIAAPPPSTSPSNPPAPTSNPPSPTDSAPIPVEDLVGGFGVGSEDLLPTMHAADDVARIAAPPELAPPIQPRRLQRRPDPALPETRPVPAPDAPATAMQDAPLLGDGAPTSPAAPPPAEAAPSSTTRDLPLVGRTPVTPVDRLADTPVSRLADASAPTTTSTPSTPSTASTTLTPTTPSTPSAPSTPSPESASSTAPSVPAVPLVGDTPLASPSSTGAPEAIDVTPGGGDLPLHVPTASTPPMSSPSVSSPPVSSPSVSSPPIEPPIQRLADTSAPPSASSPTAADAPGGDDTTSLVGDRPLVTSAPEDEEAATPATDVAAVADLPLAHRPAPSAADGDDPRPDPASTTAPTLGSDADPMVSVQTLGEGAGETHAAPSRGTGNLPLVPVELGGTLAPPIHASPADAPPSPEASSVTRPLVSPRSSAPSAMAGAVQRLVDGSTNTAAAASAMPFVRPIGAASAGLGLQRSTTTTGTTPMSTLGAPSATGAASAMPVPMRRLGTDEASAGIAASSDGSIASDPRSVATVDHPLARVQRLESAPSTATPSANGHATPDLPLHTPAVAVPTATDVAVRAGLAERAPDGSLLYTSPPARTLHLQRESLPSVGQAEAQPSGAAMPSGALSAAPGASSGVAASANGDSGSDRDAQADTKNLSEEAKRLYPFIRSALEADIRRQLEGKSRASRFRP